jgi:hypothetical protein
MLVIGNALALLLALETTQTCFPGRFLLAISITNAAGGIIYF